MPNIIPPDDPQRLQSLYSYEILDTPPDGAFDQVASLAAHLFNAPIGLVTLVDEDRVWFKSRYGLDASEVGREPGLCASVILSDDAYVVENALTDPRTLANPLVAGEMGLRFYAAAPLITHDGFRLGTVNIIDFEPRDFSTDGEKTLKELAGIVIEQMEVRLSARKAIASLTEAFRQANDCEEVEKLLTVCAWSKKIKLDGQWLSFEEFLVGELGLSITHGIHPEMMAEMLAQAEGS